MWHELLMALPGPSESRTDITKVCRCVSQSRRLQFGDSCVRRYGQMVSTIIYSIRYAGGKGNANRLSRAFIVKYVVRPISHRNVTNFSPASLRRHPKHQLIIFIESFRLRWVVFSSPSPLAPFTQRSQPIAPSSWTSPSRRSSPSRDTCLKLRYT